MSTLYIANATKQHNIFAYRLPEQLNILKITIAPGKQGAISNLRPEDVQSIIEQHHVYGIKAVSEVGHVKDFIGMVYSVDTPVKLKHFDVAIDHNNEVLTAKGAEIRKQAAAAANANLSNQMQNFEPETTVEIIEQSKAGDPNFNQTINEEIVVSKKAKRK